MPNATIKVTISLPPELHARVVAQPGTLTAAVIEALTTWVERKEGGQ